MRHSKNIFIAGVILLATLGAFAQTPEPRGLAELKKGDYDNAFKLLSARLASNANDRVAQRALLRVYIETGRYAEAETTAKRFLQKSPEPARSVISLPKHSPPPAAIPKPSPNSNVPLLIPSSPISSKAICAAPKCST